MLTARLERCNLLFGPVQDAGLQAKSAILNWYSIVVTIIDHVPKRLGTYPVVPCHAVSRTSARMHYISARFKVGELLVMSVKKWKISDYSYDSYTPD